MTEQTEQIIAHCTKNLGLRKIYGEKDAEFADLLLTARAVTYTFGGDGPIPEGDFYVVITRPKAVAVA